MAILPANIGRVSNQLRSNVALNQIQRTQARLLQTQNQLTTGRKLNAPSEDPGEATIAQQLRKTLERREAYNTNLARARNGLSEVDSTLGQVSDLILQAEQLASANVGDNVTQDERDGAAQLVKSIYQQLVTLGNHSFEGSYLFGGDKLDQPPFEEFAGGIKFNGSATTLLNQFDESYAGTLQVDGDQVWGALSTRIESSGDNSPVLTASTRIDAIKGTTGEGVQLGVIQVSDGTTSANVDLTQADTIQDVVDAINNAGVGTLAASFNGAGDGIQITGGAGDEITVLDLGGGRTAADFGIRTPVSGGTGAPVIGLDIQPQITPLTPISALNNGLGIDSAGIIITNGTKTATIDFAGAVTVEDMLNAINGADVGVRAEIKPDGTGLRLLNPTQGNEMRVAENGGTTASDLGLRSFDTSSVLADLNAGKGVRTVDGVDFQIADSNGVAFDVDLDGSTQTIQDVIDAINTAATGAGAGVVASFATTGNGIVLTDTAAGAGTLTLTPQNFSQAAADLGINKTSAGGLIEGDDVHQVIAQGVFANINKLQQAMLGGDQKAMTEAAEALKVDLDRVVRERGKVGAQVQDIESRQARLEDQNITTKELLSKIEDTDFTAAISEFSLLQTSLQASLQTTGQVLNLSLIDFLR
jgi:flagellar hook-associated protein 3 FlgL